MRFKVIYLDDEQALLDIFVEAHSGPGYEIEVHSNPNAALASVRERAPDLLILDHRLPGITGDEIALQLGQTIRKVLITGDLSVAPKAQFIRVFQKPYHPDEMQAFIDQCRADRAS